MAITNRDGVVQERYVYDAFGNVNGLNSDWNRTFTGQVYDNEAGLMLYRNRFYSPELGRFLQRDPIGYEAGDLNLVRYVGNRTTRYVDPNGLSGGFPRYPSEAESQDATRRSRCDAQKNFDQWYKSQTADTAWQNGLPECPCSVTFVPGYITDDVGHWHVDTHTGIYDGPITGGGIFVPNVTWHSITDEWSIESRNLSGVYHPGANFCMRSKTSGTSSSTKSRSQCCYDAAGALITSGMAAGSADRNESPGSRWPHLTADMTPADQAWEADGGCFGKNSEQYYNARPPIGAGKCKPNPVTPPNKKCPENTPKLCCK